MPWFRVDDGLASHPKARKAGLEAMGLWAVAGAYCSQYLTEGAVPDWYVAGWPRGRKLAARLIDAKLWFATDDGWQFHQWAERQPTKEQVELDKEAARKRQERWRNSHRDRDDANGVSNAVTDGVTNSVSNAFPGPAQPLVLPTEELQQQPTVVAAPPTANQRAQSLTKGYVELEPISNFPAVLGIVKKVILSSRYSDAEVGEALTRLAKDGRPVTTGALKVELDGMPAARAGPSRAAARTNAHHALVADFAAADPHPQTAIGP